MTTNGSTDPRFPALGFGLGLRVDHYEDLLADTQTSQPTRVDWLEVLSENYMIPGGRPLDYLARLSEHYPLVMHGVSMSIGSTDPLDRDYLKQLKQLAASVQPAWISDHLCWTGVDGTNLHDLMPLPYTEEALIHVCARVGQVQEILGRRILLENVSSYVAFHESQMSEWEFLAELTKRADCLLLLDINNVFVSGSNHGFDPHAFLAGIPVERVQQFHLAGHSYEGGLIIDTHDATIVDPVWQLYAHAVRRFGDVSTMIERDDHVPPLDTLLTELDYARAIAAPILDKAAA